MAVPMMHLAHITSVLWRTLSSKLQALNFKPQDFIHASPCRFYSKRLCFLPSSPSEAIVRSFLCRGPRHVLCIQLKNTRQRYCLKKSSFDSHIARTAATGDSCNGTTSYIYHSGRNFGVFYCVLSYKPSILYHPFCLIRFVSYYCACNHDSIEMLTRSRDGAYFIDVKNQDQR